MKPAFVMMLRAKGTTFQTATYSSMGSSVCSPRGSLRTVLATISPFVTTYGSASRPLIGQRYCLPHGHFQDSDVAECLLDHVVPALMFSPIV